jgi:hypothetical protein
MATVLGARGEALQEVHGPLGDEDFAGKVLGLSGRPTPQKIYRADHLDLKIEATESLGCDCCGSPSVTRRTRNRTMIPS